MHFFHSTPSYFWLPYLKFEIAYSQFFRLCLVVDYFRFNKSLKNSSFMLNPRCFQWNAYTVSIIVPICGTIFPNYNTCTRWANYFFPDLAVEMKIEKFQNSGISTQGIYNNKFRHTLWMFSTVIRFKPTRKVSWIYTNTLSLVQVWWFLSTVLAQRDESLQLLSILAASLTYQFRLFIQDVHPSEGRRTVVDEYELEMHLKTYYGCELWAWAQ